MKKILVVDDEPSIVTLLTFNLEKAGYAVTSANDGQEALDLAFNHTFDFIILDVMLPKMDGLEITKALRREKIETPILILTAKDEQIDKIVGLEIGADDYLTKPFSPREVLARMKAIFRRLPTSVPTTDTGTAAEPTLLKIGEIVVNEAELSVTVRQQPVDLTPKEYELLLYFMKRKNQVIRREVLLQKIWQYEQAGQSRIVDIHISHLREKIEVNPKNPRYLITVRGFGYRFEEPKS